MANVSRKDSILGLGRDLNSRARSASLNVVHANPQLGVWQAAGTAIAHAPNLNELRDARWDGSSIPFTAQGHAMYFAPLPREQRQQLSLDSSPKDDEKPQGSQGNHGHEQRRDPNGNPQQGWSTAVANGIKAFGNFVTTPTGFVFTVYFLNIVAWGAMLVFLLLKAAPAMNYPDADDNNSPRKKWLEICSQILNALFCVTAFGLAPWRFRDLYLLIRTLHWRDAAAVRKLASQNTAWFRPPAWAYDTGSVRPPTATGHEAPPTPLWKLALTIWMMVLNTLLQVVLCYFMWHYNRIDRPTWATGTFIALGCGVAMLAGIMSWWEGRKVKKIEGPQLQPIKEQA